jgi:hypothetical protein|tara:strand:+ start:75 stop:803 length:729 start_codon:yes stop_codon:yes gene_type:complete
MANQRALEMESESEDEDELVMAATAKATQEGEFSNVPAPGVKPLLLASPNAKKLALERKTKKPTIVFDDDDDDDDEEIMPTQTASQMQTSPPKKSPKKSPKRASTSPRSPAKRRKVVEPDVPASPPIGIVGRVVNAAAEALGFSSPFKASQAESPLVGAAGFASPSAPTSLMMSPGTMTNIVGSVARSVLDDDEDHAGKVEWGSRGGYEGGKRGARRKLDLADENASPSKKSTTARALERLR